MRMDMEKKSSLAMLREEEKPYEKCAAQGPGALTVVELLSVILRTGAEGVSVIDMARNLVDSFEPEGISGLCSATMAELTRVRGIGRIKAMQLLCIAELSKRIAKSVRGDAPVFTGPYSVADYYMEDLRHERQEKVLVAMLDTKGRLLGEEIIAKGTVNYAAVSPREIFLTALDKKAVSIILVHNHPSGDPEPSEEDLVLTRRVLEAGDMIGIPLLDHIIIGDRKAVSLAELIQNPDEPEKYAPIPVRDQQ